MDDAITSCLLFCQYRKRKQADRTGQMIDLMGVILWELKVDEAKRALPSIPDDDGGALPNKSRLPRRSMKRLTRKVGQAIVALTRSMGRERDRAVQSLLSERERRAAQR